MILSFVAVDKNVQLREFSCAVKDLEAALSFLNRITAQGDSILKAQVSENGGSTQLAPDAFDGQSFREPLRKLQDEWQTVLKETEIAKPWKQELARQRVKIYEERLKIFEATVRQLEALVEETHLFNWQDARRDNLIHHYESMLLRYQEYIRRTRASKLSVQDELRQRQYSPKNG